MTLRQPPPTPRQLGAVLAPSANNDIDDPITAKQFDNLVDKMDMMTEMFSEALATRLSGVQSSFMEVNSSLAQHDARLGAREAAAGRVTQPLTIQNQLDGHLAKVTVQVAQVQANTDKVVAFLQAGATAPLAAPDRPPRLQLGRPPRRPLRGRPPGPPLLRPQTRRSSSSAPVSPRTTPALASWLSGST
jgi:hypothetical protein